MNNKNGCKYCLREKDKNLLKWKTSHQASENDYSLSFVVGDTFVTQAFKNDQCVSEINVDILFCPFCGRKISN